MSVLEQSRTTTTRPVEAAKSPEITTHVPGSVYLTLAEELSPICVYAPTYLPAGAALADCWWPVLELAHREDYEGPVAGNPRVDTAETGRSGSAEVLYQLGEGWLLMVENFRGDLGDIVGEVVGSVNGRQVTKYVFDGCVVAQWSEEGCWYAVFARNVDEAEVVKVALSSGKVDSPIRSSK